MYSGKNGLTLFDAHNHFIVSGFSRREQEYIFKVFNVESLTEAYDYFMRHY